MTIHRPNKGSTIVHADAHRAGWERAMRRKDARSTKEAARRAASFMFAWQRDVRLAPVQTGRHVPVLPSRLLALAPARRNGAGSPAGFSALAEPGRIGALPRGRAAVRPGECRRTTAHPAARSAREGRGGDSRKQQCRRGGDGETGFMHADLLFVPKPRERPDRYMRSWQK